MPHWWKSSAIQQGIIFCCVTFLSLFLMAVVTLTYVHYELDEQNIDIVESALEVIRGYEVEMDDDPIDDDEILDILTTGFVVSGLLVSILSAFTVGFFSRQSQRRISKIEHVLQAAAEGTLSARTGEVHSYDDLSQIALSLDDMLSRLEGSVTSMRDISSNIAHELKTPITRLRHDLLTFRDKAEQRLDDDILLEDLDNALDESQRLAAIFDALLRISQIESGARRSRFTQLDLVPLLETVAEIYTDVAEDAQMHCSVSLPENPVLIEGDKELLIQLVANLIENAIRYCPPKSEIKLGCGVTGTQAWISVEDNGIGISDAEKERVFERMYRVDKSRTDGGLGLGLSLVKAVTKLHQGNIRLYDCTPGLGIEIHIPQSHHLPSSNSKIVGAGN